MVTFDTIISMVLFLIIIIYLSLLVYIIACSLAKEREENSFRRRTPTDVTQYNIF